MPIPLVGTALAWTGRRILGSVIGKAAAGTVAGAGALAVGNRIPGLRRLVPGEDKGPFLGTPRSTRRRRRRLATKGDMQDIAAMKGILGDGKNFATWMATSIANRR